MLYIRFIDSFSNFYFDNRDRDVGRHCSVGYCIVVKTCHFSLKYVIFFYIKFISVVVVYYLYINIVVYTCLFVFIENSLTGKLFFFFYPFI